MVSVKFSFTMLIAILSSSLQSYAQANVEQLRDPTKPISYTAKKAALRKVQLSGIFVRGETLTAVVNGQSVVANDKLDDIVIVAISRNAIKYKRRGKIFNLFLKPKITR